MTMIPFEVREGEEDRAHTMGRQRNVSCVPCPVHTSSADNCCVNILTEECQRIFLLPLLLYIPFVFSLLCFCLFGKTNEVRRKSQTGAKGSIPKWLTRAGSQQTKDLLAEQNNSARRTKSMKANRPNKILWLKQLCLTRVFPSSTYSYASLHGCPMTRPMCKHEQWVHSYPSSIFSQYLLN